MSMVVGEQSLVRSKSSSRLSASSNGTRAPDTRVSVTRGIVCPIAPTATNDNFATESVWDASLAVEETETSAVAALAQTMHVQADKEK